MVNRAVSFILPQNGHATNPAKASYQQVGLTLLWPWSARIDQSVWTIVP